MKLKFERLGELTMEHMMLMFPNSISTRRQIRERINYWNDLQERYQYSACPGDGSCLFHALLRSGYVPPNAGHNSSAVLALRSALVMHIRSHRELYEDFHDGGSFDQYLVQMERNNAWGDHIMIQAFANMTGITVVVHAQGAASSQFIAPSSEFVAAEGTAAINVLFTGGNHYDYLCPIEDVPGVVSEVESTTADTDDDSLVEKGDNDEEDDNKDTDDVDDVDDVDMEEEKDNDVEGDDSDGNLREDEEKDEDGECGHKLSAYEKKRLMRIERNEKKLHELGLGPKPKKSEVVRSAENKGRALPKTEKSNDEVTRKSERISSLLKIPNYDGDEDDEKSLSDYDMDEDESCDTPERKRKLPKKKESVSKKPTKKTTSPKQAAKQGKGKIKKPQVKRKISTTKKKIEKWYSKPINDYSKEELEEKVKESGQGHINALTKMQCLAILHKLGLSGTGTAPELKQKITLVKNGKSDEVPRGFGDNSRKEYGQWRFKNNPEHGLLLEQQDVICGPRGSYHYRFFQQLKSGELNDFGEPSDGVFHLKPNKFKTLAVDKLGMPKAEDKKQLPSLMSHFFNSTGLRSMIWTAMEKTKRSAYEIITQDGAYLFHKDIKKDLSQIQLPEMFEVPHGRFVNVRNGIPTRIIPFEEANSTLERAGLSGISNPVPSLEFCSELQRRTTICRVIGCGKIIKGGRSGYDQNLCGYHWSMCVFYDKDNNENWKMEDDDED